jgi:hypothetical protein
MPGGLVSSVLVTNYGSVRVRWICTYRAMSFYHRPKSDGRFKERNSSVEKPELLKKLEAILDDAEHRKMFGAIEIEIRGGRATVIRKTETDRLEHYDESNGEKTHATQKPYRR